MSTVDEEAVLAIHDATLAAAASVESLREEVALEYAAAQADARADFEAARNATRDEFRAAVAEVKAAYAAERESVAAACAEEFPDSEEMRAECEKDRLEEPRAEARAAYVEARREARTALKAAKVAFHEAIDAKKSEIHAAFKERVLVLQNDFNAELGTHRAALKARGVDEDAVRVVLRERGDPAAKTAYAGAFAVRAKALDACRDGAAAASDACARLERLSARSAASDAAANPLPACSHLVSLAEAGRKTDADAVRVGGERLTVADCRRIVEEDAPDHERVAAEPSEALTDACRKYVVRYREAVRDDPRATPPRFVTEDGTSLTYGLCVRVAHSAAAAKAQVDAAAPQAPAATDAARDGAAGVGPAERARLVEAACARLKESGESSRFVAELGTRVTLRQCATLDAAPTVEVS